ncbi:hypothetical protein AAF302_000005 [Pluralibacter gergoviae]|uniref:hypothetical protein n=1 Tax=Pluralibacter gergoviae TaxID=61647 RepID=UPI000651BDF3|nr:hypothetical protein [Pluralibacter gergoviae]KMK35071.1 hypothetical protein ABW13_24195 [Pluralibacter gergoviae]
MAKKQMSVAENTLSKKDKNIVDVHYTSCQCYFRPETGELIFLSEADSGEFDDLTTKLSLLMDKLEDAKHKFSAALEEYYDRKNDIANQENLSSYYNEVITFEHKVESATKAIQNEVGEFNEQSGYTHLVELIALEPLKKGIYGRLYCYIKKSDYEAFQGKLTIFDIRNFGSGDFYQRDKEGNIVSIDSDKIKDSLKKIKESLKQMASGKKKFSIKTDYEKNLADWADAWNKQADYSIEEKYIDVSAGAQFLRFSSNVGAMVDWSPRDNKGRISGEASAELTLAAGQASTTFYQPDRGGWRLKFIINEENKEANLGILRTQIDVKLTCFAGASANIEGNLQFVMSGGQGKLMGRRAPFSHLNERQNGVRVDTEKQPSASTEINVEMFAGAKAGGSYRGALQWLKPFDSLVDSLPDMLRTFGLEAAIPEAKVLDKVLESRSQLEGKDAEKGRFTDFGAFTVGAELQLGAGISGDFQFWFEEGKFKFHISAGVCLGPGAKGVARGEINPAQFTEFAIWVIYQLYGMDYKHFKVIGKDAFKALTYILLMGGVSVYKRYYNSMKGDVEIIQDDFQNFIYKIKKDMKDAINASNKRNKFADSINLAPAHIYYLTPEGKGIALYLLTLDGSYDRIDIDNIKLVSLIDSKENGLFAVPDIGHERKRAVLAILSSIQTKREWGEVLIRMTSTGDKIALGLSDKAQIILIKQQEKLLRSFLQIGLDQDKKLDELINRLEMRDFEEVYKRLKSKPAFGYPFAPNCTRQYALHCDENLWYSSLCYIVPEDPTIKYHLEPK